MLTFCTDSRNCLQFPIQRTRYGRPNSICLFLFVVVHYVFNYACHIQLIFSIQRVIQYSILHSTFNYSFYIQFFSHPFNYLFNNFNYLFNIQLQFLKHSTIHSTFNLNSTFSYSFNIQLFVSVHTLLSPYYFWSVMHIIAC